MMEQLDPEAARLLGLVREARTPSEQDKARVAGKLGAALWLFESAATSSAAAQVAVKSGLGLKLAWLGAVVVVIGGVTFTQLPAKKPAPAVSKPAPSAPATLPPPPPAPSVPMPAPTPIPAARSVTDKPPRKTSLAEELSLLHRAQSEWRGGDAAAALTRLHEHRKVYPRSQLWPERDALTVLCLCSLGREDEARKLGSRFLKAAPESPLRTSVEGSCAGR